MNTNSNPCRKTNAETMKNTDANANTKTNTNVNTNPIVFEEAAGGESCWERLIVPTHSSTPGIMERKVNFKILPKIQRHILGKYLSSPNTKAHLEEILVLPKYKGISWEILVLPKYRVSLKKGTFLIFCLISVLEVGFYFFTCVSESEFRSRFI